MLEAMFEGFRSSHSRILLDVELYDTVHAMGELESMAEWGKTTSSTIRVTKRCHGSHRAVV